ncbi:MAG: fatty acid desaturase [Rhodobacterales bacterium 12-65-15]|nr:MAG: fatty acid desaturase [Rhodobacterales bacterium 12-65-15]
MPDDQRNARTDSGTAIEWPTLAVFIATYALWGVATALVWPVSPLLATLLTALAIAQYSSLTHEVLHGHPFRSRWLSEALVFPAFTVFVPYLRFKDLHLQHHFDPNLTDPYDDPESNFAAPADWAAMSAPRRAMLRFNNTLLGRMILGPAISCWALVTGDLRAIRAGDRRVALGWGLHLAGIVPVLVWLGLLGTMPLWAYALAAYLGWSLLKIRTYLEHRAHDAARARTVVIESRGPLAFLFLNNNFHVVHHMHPTTAWYKLPALYFGNREHYLRRNEGYVFRNYAEIFRQYLLQAKDPVPHPLWPVAKGDRSDNPAEPRGGAGIVEERHTGLIAASR